MARSSQAAQPRPSGPNALDRRSIALLTRVVASGPDGVETDGASAAALSDRGLARRDAQNRLTATDEGRAHAARIAGGEIGFFAQHRAVGRRPVVIDARIVEALIDLDESPLAWLARRKTKDGKPLLAVEEVAAGERRRADFTRGQMQPRVTASWEASVSRGRRSAGAANVDMADSVIAARKRVSQALDAVGPELSGALIDVCCFLKGMEEVERDRGWPARGAKLVLGLALARLARHYGFLVDPATQGPGRIVDWSASDARPPLSAELPAS